MERIRQKTSGHYPLSVATRDEDGVTTTPAGTLTISIADGGGTVVETGTPTVGDGVLTYDADVTKLAYLDTYAATWTDTDTAVTQWRSQVEICGGYLFEIADLRAFDSVLASTTKYPADKLRAARTAAEQRFETAFHLSFVPRGRRYTAVGDGGTRLRVPDNALRSLRAATLGSVALTVDEVAAIVTREWGAFDRDDGNLWDSGEVVTIWYEHGEDSPPAPVSQAVMVLAREYMVASSLSSRAVTEATEIGFFRLSIAGRDGATGIPEVDEVGREFGRPRPGIG